jgi:uridine kinase
VSQERDALLRRLVSAIVAPGRARRVAVGIDGPDTAGKTTFAAALAATLAPAGPVERLELDSFLRPAAERKALTPTPETYFRNAFDLDAFRAQLSALRVDSHVVADGVFLLRHELRDEWDISIHLGLSTDEILRRARTRDAGRFGGADAAERRYRERYLPAQRRYEQVADPIGRADIVIRNDDPERPIVQEWRLQ